MKEHKKDRKKKSKTKHRNTFLKNCLMEPGPKGPWHSECGLDMCVKVGKKKGNKATNKMPISAAVKIW